MAGKGYLLLLSLMGLEYLAVGFLQILQEGDVCYTRNNNQGVCTRVRACPGALFRIMNRSKGTKFCSYDKEAIICCEFPPPPTDERIIFQPEVGSQQLDSIQIVEKKCEEYAEYAYVTRELETLLPFRETVRELRCPIAGEQLIVGGQAADLGEFPHMVALGYDDETRESKVSWSCGGSLISDQFVLTAAHCRARDGVKVQYVRVGALNLETENNKTKPQNFRVIQFIKHELYKFPYKYHDIGLVKLHKKVELGLYIRPACIHTNPDELRNVKYLTATGFGVTHKSNTFTSDVLMKVSLELFPHSKCKDAYSDSVELRQGIDESSMICAGDPMGVKDTCGGDSGGPMQVRRRTPECTHSIVAVTSFGSDSCVSDDHPGVYTRVSYYVPWIQSHVWP